MTHITSTTDKIPGASVAPEYRGTEYTEYVDQHEKRVVQSIEGENREQIDWQAEYEVLHAEYRAEQKRRVEAELDLARLTDLSEIHAELRRLKDVVPKNINPVATIVVRADPSEPVTYGISCQDGRSDRSVSAWLGDAPRSFQAARIIFLQKLLGGQREASRRADEQKAAAQRIAGELAGELAEGRP